MSFKQLSGLIATPGKVLDLNPKSEGGSTEGVCLPLETPGEPIEEVVATPQVRRTGQRIKAAKNAQRLMSRGRLIASGDV